ILRTGIIPGNRNADNIAAELEQFEYILYPSRSIQTDGVKAGLLKSFGFGQVGGEILAIHPDYLLATLTREQLEAYVAKVGLRESKSYRYWHDTLTGVRPFVNVKSEAPYTDAQEKDVYLNPLARAEYNSSAKKYLYKKTNQAQISKIDSQTVQHTKSVLEQLAGAQAEQSSSSQSGVGVDVELVSAVNTDNETFVERNFTAQERAYCQARPDVAASFAGKWCAKEAVIKAVSSLSTDKERVWTRGAAAPLSEIEIQIGTSGAPVVVFHGSAKEAAEKAGVSEVKVSISHTDAYAIATAIAN
ncbi:fatty acid synthase alpha subunit Lsd1, partial [Dipsacomyces acuminosporus]